MVVTCNICHCNLNLDQISALKCGHTFHLNCVNGWLEKSRSCPTCRVEILGIENGDVIAKLFLENGPADLQSSDFDRETQFTLILECMSDLGAKFESFQDIILNSKEDIGDMNKKITAIGRTLDSFTDSCRNRNDQILAELASIRDRNNNIEYIEPKNDQDGTEEDAEAGTEYRDAETQSD
uniref:RING-type domain-containing protein n=1 Tax=Romanomermis culicivorax TaxID=13658 RepID=A0A915ITF3_ROMCU